MSNQNNIMWGNFLLVIFTIIAINLNAQIPFSGIIIEQNSKHRPLEGIQVTAVGANPVITDDKGEFTLIFSLHIQAGMTVEISIKDDKYQVINTDVLNNTTLRTDKKNFIRVVMCLHGTIAQNTLKYYNRTEKILTQSHKKLINDLKENKISLEKLEQQLQTQLASKNAAILYLNQQLEKAKIQVDALAKKFARTNFDDVSSTYKRAFDLFQEGKIKEARALLNADELRMTGKKLKIKKIKLEQKLDSTKLAIKQNWLTIMLADSLLCIEFDSLQLHEIRKNVYLQSNNLFVSIKGKVLDQLTKKSLSNISIKIKGTNIKTLTDNNGFFLLQLPILEQVSHQILIISSKEYITQEHIIQWNKPVFEIFLHSK